MLSMKASKATSMMEIRMANGAAHATWGIVDVIIRTGISVFLVWNIDALVEEAGTYWVVTGVVTGTVVVLLPISEQKVSVVVLHAVTATYPEAQMEQALQYRLLPSLKVLPSSHRLRGALCDDP